MYVVIRVLKHRIETVNYFIIMRQQLCLILIALTTLSLSSRKPFSHINTSFLLMKARQRPNNYLFRALQYRNFKKGSLPKPKQFIESQKKSSELEEEIAKIHVKWYNRIS